MEWLKDELAVLISNQQEAIDNEDYQTAEELQERINRIEMFIL